MSIKEVTCSSCYLVVISCYIL